MAVPPLPLPAARATPGLIEVRLREVSQLFNSMDPSPFQERDLDADAEEFIISWALEHPLRQRLKLVVYLARPPPGGDAAAAISQAVRHYFAYRAELNRREFGQLMRQGRTSLIVGLSFLATCFVAAQLIGRTGADTWRAIVRESLTIGGWVAMWRPLQIYLYDWWPVRHRGMIYRKLSVMDVEVRGDEGGGSAPRVDGPGSAG